ncbi:MAG TPA: zf-HC2 domain-containing protein [Acidimicrobiales bacterium]|nr:zf-HC2 domain-containing protein [Acidimicrobiales bacterium]
MTGDPGGPTCDLVLESVSATLDGEAAPVAPDAVARHLATCPACAAAARALEGVARLEPRPVGATPALPAGVRADAVRAAGLATSWQPRRRAQGGGWRRAVTVAAVAAPLLAAVGLAASPDPAAAGPHPVLSTPCTRHLPAVCRQRACAVTASR